MRYGGQDLFLECRRGVEASAFAPKLRSDKTAGRPFVTGQAVFADDEDRKRFLQRLAEACRKNRLRHLRVETTMTLDWIARELNMGVTGSLANQLRKKK